MDHQIDRTIDFTKLQKNGERKLPIPSFLKTGDKSSLLLTPKKSKFSIFGGKTKLEEADRGDSFDVQRDSMVANKDGTVFAKNAKSKFFDSKDEPLFDTEMTSERDDSIVVPDKRAPEEDDSPSRADLMNIGVRRHNIIDSKIAKKLCNTVFQFLVLPSKQEVIHRSSTKRPASKHKLVLNENYVPSTNL
mmetsp:Transcript_32213/g.49267  ORF Transcript_32213/g.49267 Transcript_32213/m.49267 type:complete len:190 (-) Transcript_32213:1384-1953(-)